MKIFVFPASFFFFSAPSFGVVNIGGRGEAFSPTLSSALPSPAPLCRRLLFLLAVLMIPVPRGAPDAGADRLLITARVPRQPLAHWSSPPDTLPQSCHQSCGTCQLWLNSSCDTCNAN